MTAENNEIWWSNLAPGQYRWRLDSQAVVKISPRFEVARVTFDSEGIARTNDPPPSDLSGVFVVKAGETTQLESEVEMHAGITGVLVEAAQAEALSSVIIRLRHRGVFTNPVKSGQDVYINDTEGSGRPDQDGRFLLTPVKPGEKVLTASWRVGEEFFYSTQKISVAPGEVLDLGGIYCQPGLSITGLIRFQTPNGEHVPKEQLFGQGVEPKLDMIFNSGSDVPTENGISEFFHPSLDQPFVIHGLMPGDYFVLVEPDGDGWPELKGGFSIAQRKTAEVEFDVRKQSSFEVNLLADALCQLKLSAVIPNATKAPYLRGVLVSGRDAYEVQLSPARAEGVASVGTVQLPSGRYELWLRSVPPDNADPENGWALHTELFVPFAANAESTVSMNMTESVRVKVLSAEGQPASNRVVMFSPQSLANREKPHWLYRGKLDDQGFVNLGGSLEGESLVGFKLSGMVSAGSNLATVRLR